MRNQAQPQQLPQQVHRFRLKDRGREIELEGSREFVEKHMLSAARYLSPEANSTSQKKAVNAAQLALPWDSANENELPSANESPFNNVASTAIEQPALDLVSYYRQIAKGSEINQRAQLLIISRHAMKYDEKMELSNADFESAFAKLRVIPVKPPAKISASLADMKKGGLVYQPSEGTFAITDKGNEYLNELLNRA